MTEKFVESEPMMTFRMSRLGGLWLVVLLVLVGCAEESLASQRERAAREAGPGDPITIGFVWPFSAEYDLLPEGVYMAVEEINAAGGLLNGRPVQLVERDDFDSVKEARFIAQEFAENPQMTAVIGHAWSYISVPAAPIYEFNELIMLSPSATSPDLTREDFSFIFRNVPSDNEVGRQLAQYAYGRGYERVMILYVNESYGRQLSNVFENEASALGMTIVDRQNYRTTRNFSFILENWLDEAFDMIFIAGSNPAAATFIEMVREAGIDVPIIGSDGLDTDELWTVAGQDAAGTVVASFYHRDNPNPLLRDFIQRFRERYEGLTPDTWAAQGYDAMNVLAHAIEQAGSTVPSEVAAALHATQDWPGVTGTHSFNELGDVVGKPIVLKIMRRQAFQFLQLAQ